MFDFLRYMILFLFSCEIHTSVVGRLHLKIHRVWYTLCITWGKSVLNSELYAFCSVVKSFLISVLQKVVYKFMPRRKFKVPFIMFL